MFVYLKLLNTESLELSHREDFQIGFTLVGIGLKVGELVIKWILSLIDEPDLFELVFV